MQQIKELSPDHSATILDIINDAANAYKGAIPDDRWKEPYMSTEELAEEIRAGIRFYGWFEDSFLPGIVGSQNVGRLELIRHCYVRSDYQRRGIGGDLLQHLLSLSHASQVLVGTRKTQQGQFGFMSTTDSCWFRARRRISSYNCNRTFPRGKSRHWLCLRKDSKVNTKLRKL